MPMMMSVLAVKDKRMRVYNDETFLVFHNEHPEIYEGFRKYAMKALAVRNRWSARAIFHLLRWDTLLDSGGEYKICDGWRKRKKEGGGSTRAQCVSEFGEHKAQGVGKNSRQYYTGIVIEGMKEVGGRKKGHQ